jgi:hypothetical protein
VQRRLGGGDHRPTAGWARNSQAAPSGRKGNGCYQASKRQSGRRPIPAACQKSRTETCVATMLRLACCFGPVKRRPVRTAAHQLLKLAIWALRCPVEREGHSSALKRLRNPFSIRLPRPTIPPGRFNHRGRRGARAFPVVERLRPAHRIRPSRGDPAKTPVTPW